MRKILLLFFCFLLTGCTLNYNINIDSDYITETINLTIPDDKLNPEAFQELTSSNNSVYLYKKKYYDVNYTRENNSTIFDYSFKHKLKDYNDAKVLGWCYQDRNIKEDFDNIIIELNGAFDCANMEDQNHISQAKINITTKLKVLENNADKINGDTYTWIINEDNYTNKPIKMVIKKNSDVKKLKENTNLLLICLGIFIIPVVLVITFIYLKSKNKDKF